MQKRTDRFLSLSAAFTGFSRLELLGTGMVDEYLLTVADNLLAGLSVTHGLSLRERQI